MEFSSKIWQNLDKKNQYLFHGDINTSFFAYHLNSYLQHHAGEVPFILCPDSDIDSIYTDIKSLCPGRSIIKFTGHDVSPYSNLLPNRRCAKARMKFLTRMLRPLGNEIFLAKASDTLFLSLTPQLIKEHSRNISIGDELDNEFFIFLDNASYTHVDICEEPGHYAQKGGVIDIFSPYHDQPIRIELFGDQVESLRFYDPESQLSTGTCKQAHICPSGEFNYTYISAQKLSHTLIDDITSRGLNKEAIEHFLNQISRKFHFPELDHLFAYSNIKKSTLWNFLSPSNTFFVYNKIACTQDTDQFIQKEKALALVAQKNIICPSLDNIYQQDLDIAEKIQQANFVYSAIALQEEGDTFKILPCRIQKTDRLKDLYTNYKQRFEENFFKDIKDFIKSGGHLILNFNSETKAKRVLNYFHDNDIKQLHAQDEFIDLSAQQSDKGFYSIDKALNHSFLYELDNVLFLGEAFFFGSKSRISNKKTTSNPMNEMNKLSFSDLKPGDKIIHISNGIGVFEGMKDLEINGIRSELLCLRYKGGDKIYLPIYRIHQIQKYHGSNVLDKLGSNSWERAKVKVKNALRDIAAQLLKTFAKRAKYKKIPFSEPNHAFHLFEESFPYEETEDQLKSIEAIITDMVSDKPMDRLVCGDVGFGKTEVAMRAAYKAAMDRRQVVVLVPTTILALQHYDSFRKRFQPFDINVEMLSRFTPKKSVKGIIAGLKNGKVNIVIGTHRLLSNDIDFFDLGLLVIDEEHRFGVTHKEKVRNLKSGIDTLAMSATPIPRSLNMSILGIRDLSLIATPPLDRLPIRTYLCKQNMETLKQAITSEIQRGGQVYFLHNRVQSIYQKEQELKDLVPGLKICVGHGQMPEDELEKIVVDFFQGKYDLFLCTTIIESGIDNPRANTIIIDNAQRFGLSQLYQIRGRVGRGKERAYCYLVIPTNLKLDKPAQERLRVIQENTELGSGFKVASHDLDLRGAGNILGEDQSGSVNAVGYDLFMDLLDNAVREARGEAPKPEEIEPDINIPITALIPSQYIQDIRTRLSFYKIMSEAKSADDMSKIEQEIRDQFGKIPEEVISLMGIMLIRSMCKRFGIKDLKANKKGLSLRFSNKSNSIEINELVNLAMREPKKYKLTPDSRLLIFMPATEWTNILAELEHLESFASIDIN